MTSGRISTTVMVLTSRFLATNHGEYAKAQPGYQHVSMGDLCMGCRPADFRLVRRHPGKFGSAILRCLHEGGEGYLLRVLAIHQTANEGVVEPGDLASLARVVAQYEVPGDAFRVSGQPRHYLFPALHELGNVQLRILLATILRPLTHRQASFPI